MSTTFVRAPLVALCGVALIAAVATSSPAGAVAAPADEHSLGDGTIQLLETRSRGDLTDLPPEGVSYGDVYAFNSVMTDLDGNSVGRLDCTAVVTGIRGRTASLKVCTLLLDDGQITVQTTDAPSLPADSMPVTGGSGAYEGVGGQLTYEEHGDETWVVIHLIYPA